jgi:hypothetical protein
MDVGIVHLMAAKRPRLILVSEVLALSSFLKKKNNTSHSS